MSKQSKLDQENLTFWFNFTCILIYYEFFVYSTKEKDEKKSPGL